VSDKLILYWEKVSHKVIAEDSDTWSIFYTVHDPWSSRVHDDKRLCPKFLVLDHFRPATRNRLLTVRTDSTRFCKIIIIGVDVVHRYSTGFIETS
jgi:hypothetical protein